ncbi:nitrilase-related carbon-nitrogen hydrolase, partial [Thiolapillus sp.]
MPTVFALAQFNCTVGDIKGNAHKIVEWALRAKDGLGAEAVVFPELCICGYPPEDLLLRPEFLDDVERALDGICQQVRGIDVILGYPRRKAGRLYNAAGVIRNGAIVAEYFKAELPNY